MQIVVGESYIPDEVRNEEVKNALNELLVAHGGYNNFYTEVTLTKQLRRVIGENPKIPKGLEKKYIFGLVNVFLTNGHGVTSGAEPIYLELLEKLSPLQSAFAIISFTESDVSSKLQFTLCEKKYKQLLTLLQPKIISVPVKDLILEIEKFPSGNFDKLKDDPKIKQSIASLKILLK